jgi:hypothetical protein
MCCWQCGQENLKSAINLFPNYRISGEITPKGDNARFLVLLAPANPFFRRFASATRSRQATARENPNHYFVGVCGVK